MDGSLLLGRRAPVLTLAALLPPSPPLPAHPTQMCVTTVNVVGGQVARRPLSGADTSCPPGTYYDQDELCPAW